VIAPSIEPVPARAPADPRRAAPVTAAAPPAALAVARRYRSWRIRVFAACWTMYATYYLCRANISVAVPELKKLLGGGQVTPQAELMVGWIMTGLLLAYGFGQLINGLLGDRFGPRRVATVGMAVSALMNLLFGLAASFPAFLGIWIVNGLFQATGAPSRIKVMANWFPPQRRGRMMGLLGTDYVVGNALSWLLSGWLVSSYGWRWVFLVPSAILAASAVHFWLRVRNAPEDVGLPTIEEQERGSGGHGSGGGKTGADGKPDGQGARATDDRHAGWGFVLRQALLNWRVWVVGLAYFGVDLFRYGFLAWSFDYLVSHGAPVGKAVLQILMLPLVGAVGIVSSGWLTDRLGGRRAPVISVMLLVAAGLAVVFRLLTTEGGGFLLPLVVLGGIGFFLYGPHLLMGATIAMDLGSRKASATASGVIDWLGYMGAAVAGVGTAWTKTHWGWNGAFALWVAAAALAGLLMLTLWNTRSRTDQEYL